MGACSLGLVEPCRAPAYGVGAVTVGLFRATKAHQSLRTIQGFTGYVPFYAILLIHTCSIIFKALSPQITPKLHETWR